MQTEKYIVADYVNNFYCKCGSCRSCCCVGWPVTISFNEYIHLLGLQCNKALKKRIDCAFFVLHDCSPDRYAEINRNLNGECHLRDKDGMCALHKALGENALPAVCKMYPRNFKSGAVAEAACAMSCEAVLECLTNSTDKLGFHIEEFSTDNVAKNFDAVSSQFIDIQKTAIKILQNRNFTLSKRIIKLGVYIKKISGTSDLTELKVANNDSEFIKPANDYSALDVAFRLAEFLSEYSVSFGKSGKIALENFNYDSSKSSVNFVMEKYKTALYHLYKVLPNLDIYLENILVNHLFFEKFPYSYSGETYFDEYAAFTGVFALIKVVASGYMMDKCDLSDFIDCLASMFRYIEHGDAIKIIKSFLASFSFDSLSSLVALAKL